MSNVLIYIGIFIFWVYVLGWPIVAYRQYIHSSHFNKAGLVRVVLLALCAIFAVLLLILTAMRVISTTSLNILIIACLDAQFLTNWWTSPEEKWVARRKKRRSFIIMLILSIILAVALVEIFFTAL